MLSSAWSDGISYRDAVNGNASDADPQYWASASALVYPARQISI